MITYVLDSEHKNLPKIIETLEAQETDMFVTIQIPKRSLAQNSLFWANVSIIGKAQGHTNDEVNAFVKKSITQAGLLDMMSIKKTDKLMAEVYKSTADLNKKQFTILMDYIYQIGSILNLGMMYPEDMGFQNLFEK